MNDLLKQRLHSEPSETSEEVNVDEIVEALQDLVDDINAVLGDDVEEPADVTEALNRLLDIAEATRNVLSEEEAGDNDE